MKWFEKVVTKHTIQAAERILEAVGDDFYLAGGTGLALQYGHRISLDLDLFSDSNTLDHAKRLSLFDRLRTTGELEVLESADGTCHLKLENTSVSLLRYSYPLLSRKMNRWRGMLVASTEDIAAMKLSAVVGRGSKKDFVDLYHLCNKTSLEKTLGFGKKRYPDHKEFVLQACRALVYFQDAEKERMPRLLIKVSWSDIKEYFEKEIPKYLKKIV